MLQLLAIIIITNDGDDPFRPPLSQLKKKLRVQLLIRSLSMIQILAFEVDDFVIAVLI
jgi:hypothetical protein